MQRETSGSEPSSVISSVTIMHATIRPAANTARYMRATSPDSDVCAKR